MLDENVERRVATPNREPKGTVSVDVWRNRGGGTGKTVTSGYEGEDDEPKFWPEWAIARRAWYKLGINMEDCRKM